MPLMRKVAASKYRDSVSPDGTGYSLYRDVKNDHWASEYIRIAAQEGWMTGYTDSTFRPENTITLEEVCASTLRLLGYTGADLAGSFPYAHLSKASALGLRDGLDAVRGQAMTRLDCARLGDDDIQQPDLLRRIQSTLDSGSLYRHYDGNCRANRILRKHRHCI